VTGYFWFYYRLCLTANVQTALLYIDDRLYFHCTLFYCALLHTTIEWSHHTTVVGICQMMRFPPGDRRCRRYIVQIDWICEKRENVVLTRKEVNWRGLPRGTPNTPSLRWETSLPRDTPMRAPSAQSQSTANTVRLQARPSCP
jgi:hypothetical protein